jgi:hypothetical protein
VQKRLDLALARASRERDTAEMERAALNGAVREGAKLLSAVTDLMAKKDVAMGDLLQLMEPGNLKNKESASSEVDACSDRVEALQTQLDASVAALRRHIDALKEIAVKLPEEISTNEAAAAGPMNASTAEEHAATAKEHPATDIKEFPKSFINVTDQVITCV